MAIRGHSSVDALEPAGLKPLAHGEGGCLLLRDGKDGEAASQGLIQAEGKARGFGKGVEREGVGKRKRAIGPGS